MWIGKCVQDGARGTWRTGKINPFIECYSHWRTINTCICSYDQSEGLAGVYPNTVENIRNSGATLPNL